jgi:hypothetical protein
VKLEFPIMMKSFNNKSQERSPILKIRDKNSEIDLKNHKETGQFSKILKLTNNSPRRVSFKSENL